MQIEPFFNNILDCAVSERTQLSNAACKLLERLPEVLEKDLLPHLDRILPVLIKLCANTKQVTVKVAAAAVAGVIKHASYSPRLLYHVCDAFEQKPAGPKIHGTEWLQAILKQYYRSIDLHKDARMICRAISLALEDADLNVRTKSRATYWTYSRMDAEGAEEIVSKLDQHKKTALMNDPNNPNKKSSAVKKEPPRPRSALADVRKEQAKKKRAEEEAQSKKKAFNSSTASHVSHDSIEIHEPKKEIHQKEEKAQPMPIPGRSKPQPTPLKNMMNPPAGHKKTVSNDSELVSKQSQSSRLLSAPVRRPKYNVTPMTTSAAPALVPPAVRPDSRNHGNISHISQMVYKDKQQKEFMTQMEQEKKEWQKEHTRPTSSSSAKSLPSNIHAISPTAKPAVSISMSVVAPAASPRSNTTASTNTDTTFSDSKTAISTEVLEPEPTPATTPATGTAAIETAAITASQAPTQLQTPTTPPDYTHVEWHGDAHEVYDYMDPRYEIPKVKNTIWYPAPVQVPLEERTDVERREVRVELKKARSFIAQNLPNFRRGVLDPLTLKKLKAYIERHPKDLIQEEMIFMELFDTLSECLVCQQDLTADAAERRVPYSRSVILQITYMLLQQYPSYAAELWPEWIMFMLWYRCILSTDLRDRQAQYVEKNITICVDQSRDPISLIDSVLNAITTGEPILQQHINKKEEKVEAFLSKHVELNFDSIDSAPPSLPASITDTIKSGASWNKFNVRSHLRAVGETMYEPEVFGGSPESVKVGMKRRMLNALTEHNLTTMEHGRIYPKELPLLIETSLNALSIILVRAAESEMELDDRDEERLSQLAAHLLGEYDYMMKKALVRYLQALHRIMRNDWVLLDQFEPTEGDDEATVARKEGNRNLVTYYITQSQRG